MDIDNGKKSNVKFHEEVKVTKEDLENIQKILLESGFWSTAELKPLKTEKEDESTTIPSGDLDKG